MNQETYLNLSNAERMQFDAQQKMSANDRQVGGDHYQRTVQPWDAMEAWMTPEQFNGFLLGSAIAYLARFNTDGVAGKGGMLDVCKAQHYLEKLIEVNK